MWWTIEQTAQHLGMTVEQVRDTRRRKVWPGNVGVRQGKRLRFDPRRIEAGPPDEPEHTDDVATATLWMMEDMRNLLGQIHAAVADLRRWEHEKRQRENEQSPIMERDDEE